METETTIVTLHQTLVNDLIQMFDRAFMLGQTSLLDRRAESNDTVFWIYTIDKCDYTHSRIEETVKWCTGHNYYFKEFRIHKWYPDHCAQEHIDDYLPNSDTLIVTLQEDKTDRLIIDGCKIAELNGTGYIIPEGTKHEITKGPGIRYSLVGWGRRDD